MQLPHVLRHSSLLYYHHHQYNMLNHHSHAGRGGVLKVFLKLKNSSNENFLLHNVIYAPHKYRNTMPSSVPFTSTQCMGCSVMEPPSKSPPYSPRNGGSHGGSSGSEVWLRFPTVLCSCLMAPAILFWNLRVSSFFRMCSRTALKWVSDLN